MKINSKFPKMETSIFAQISAMANTFGAINLGQGFPNFETDKYLLDRLKFHSDNGANQYSPMQGVLCLRENIAMMHEREYSNKIDVNEEITVTSGATEAIFCAISSIVSRGDEVIVFDPSYDSYVPNIELNGGKAIRINLELDFSIDWSKVASSINDKTKCIILNTPHNPSGKTLTKEDLDSLWSIVKDSNIFIISDEVYQHITFDGLKHISAFNDDRMRDRTFAISSFGKTFHVTGWKIGYCIASKALSKEFRKIHQYITYCSPTSYQMALSDMIEHNYQSVSSLSSFYQEKRDLFRQGLKDSKFKILKTEGSFFQLVDYSELSSLSDVEFCKKLISEYGVAAIPISVFYEKAPEQKVIRFCFAKNTQTLLDGVSKLKKV